MLGGLYELPRAVQCRSIPMPGTLEPLVQWEEGVYTPCWIMPLRIG